MTATYPARPPHHVQQHAVAGAVIDQILTDYEEGRWPYDLWSRHCLLHGVAAYARGLYDLAKVEAVMAQTPWHERSADPAYALAELPELPLDRLRGIFDEFRGAPAREFPIFR